MYEFTPDPNKKNAKNIVSALILGGFAVMLVTSVAHTMPFKWAIQLFGIVTIALGIFVMTRYVAKNFVYRVEQTDSGADLTVTEIQKKSEITLCRIALSSIEQVHVCTSAEKEKEKSLVSSFSKDGRKRFNYCADINPEKFIWILANECGESVAVKLSFDETLCKILESRAE